MKEVLASVVAAMTLSTGAMAQSANDAMMAPVVAFIDGFNIGDRAAIEAACTPGISIIESIPPFFWNGPGALDKWLTELADYMAAESVTDASLGLGPISLNRAPLANAP